jgi:hypothetical protein
METLDRVIDAAKRDDEDALLQALVRLDIHDGMPRTEAIPAEVFSRMMYAFEVAQDKNSLCGFHIFEWLGGKYKQLTEEMKQSFEGYIAKNYFKYSEPAVVLSIAEWIGGGANEQALRVIDQWVEKTQNEVAFRHIGSALTEFENFKSDPQAHLATLLSRVKAKYEKAKELRAH